MVDLACRLAVLPLTFFASGWRGERNLWLILVCLRRFGFGKREEEREELGKRQELRRSTGWVTKREATQSISIVFVQGKRVRKERRTRMGKLALGYSELGLQLLK